MLEIRELSISYDLDATPVVNGLNFTLAQGEVLAIVGESGSGKTTVIRAVMGVLPHTGRITKGDILFEGRSLQTLTPEEWLQWRGTRMAMIFQDSGSMMNPIQTVGHQFIEYLQLHSSMTNSEAYDRSVELLASTNLRDPHRVMKAYPFELSGGMRQRVGIAMAIAFQPKLLLGDEPTAALDVTTQAQIVQELMEIKRIHGMGMIFVTHDMGVAAHMADRIMVMQAGQVVEYGPTEEVISHPQAAYTQSLLAAVPTIGGKRYV